MSTAIDTMTDTTPALTPALRRFVGEKGFALFRPGGDLVAVTDGHVAVVYDRAGLELAGVLRAVGEGVTHRAPMRRGVRGAPTHRNQAIPTTFDEHTPLFVHATGYTMGAATTTAYR